MSFQALEKKVHKAMELPGHEFNDEDSALIHELGDALKLARSMNEARLMERLEILLDEYMISLKLGVLGFMVQKTRQEENKVRSEIKKLRTVGGMTNRVKAKWLELKYGI